jgi:hypothetical protein
MLKVVTLSLEVIPLTQKVSGAEPRVVRHMQKDTILMLLVKTLTQKEIILPP